MSSQRPAEADRAKLPDLRLDPATTRLDLEGTEIGSVFVSNYPAYSFWKPEHVAEFERALQSPPRPDVQLGIYLHIPFCRKRCKFCYFKVFTDKNARQVEEYIDALVDELRMYRDLPAVAGRELRYVYFGGGTPSFLASKHLRRLVDGLEESITWDDAEEVTFECEPGTLNRKKLRAIRDIGVTRLSLGVENFDDRILEINGRAHVSKEIWEVLPWIEEIGFPQLNIDLIAGMIGETWATWKDSVEKTIDTGPETVTVYQMEVPYNTRFSREYAAGELEAPLADWKTKRDWHAYAFDRLAEAGYLQSSAYTMVKDGSTRFVYRDALWHGADMLGIGVSSFGHVSGVHAQNDAGWSGYMERVRAGELPVQRAFPTTAIDRMTREMILQLKLGHIRPSYFQHKFGTDILEYFADAFAELERLEMLEFGDDVVELTREGLLRVDSLLPTFYAPEYRDARYT